MVKFIKNKSFPFILILNILYFTQIYPFVHFHHTHNEDGFQIVVSTHPIDRHTENHNDHHSDDHQHSESDHYDVDLTFIRQPKPTPKTVTDLPTRLYSTASVVILNKPDLSYIIQKFYSHLSSPRVLISQVSPRSPPYLS